MLDNSSLAYEAILNFARGQILVQAIFESLMTYYLLQHVDHLIIAEEENSSVYSAVAHNLSTVNSLRVTILPFRSSTSSPRNIAVSWLLEGIIGDDEHSVDIIGHRFGLTRSCLNQK